MRTPAEIADCGTGGSGGGNLAISASASSVSSGTVVFSNSNNVSFGMNGSTVTASAGPSGYSVSIWKELDYLQTWNINTGIVSFHRASMPVYLSATDAVLLNGFSSVNGSSLAGSYTQMLAIYTMSGGTANLAASGSRQVSWTSGSDTSASSEYGGMSLFRYRTLPIAYSITPGDYLLAAYVSTALSQSVSLVGRNQVVAEIAAYDGIETKAFLDGFMTTNSSAFPATVAVSNVNYARVGANAALFPAVMFRGTS